MNSDDDPLLDLGNIDDDDHLLQLENSLSERGKANV